MDKFNQIRPIVLGLVRRGDKVLVQEGYDKVRKETFYRFLGGGIEFQEQSSSALKREFKEELGVDINVGDYVGLLENIFVSNGKKAHELVLVYEGSISDKDYKENYHIVDDGTEMDATWIEIEKFKNRELILYPEKVIEYL
jgi:8-oxo-dGTP pyrophosphatase MutT (NUDIX family)